MKIERVEVFGVAVPLIGEYKNAYLSKSVQKSAVVRITASGGAMGLGKLGRISRGLLAEAGSVLNYAHLGRPTVEGQWSLAQLRAATRRK